MAFVALLALFALIGVLTAIEMATFSARRERMEQAVAGGDRRGTLVKMYQRTPSDYLASIQLLATAANFVVGAMIGANIESPLRRSIEQTWPAFGYAAALSWTLSVGLVTIAAIILTNVLPKHVGFVRANEIALKAAWPMRFWMTLTSPLSRGIHVASKSIARLLRIAPDRKHRVTEADIDVLLAEGLRAGSLDPTEQAVMRRALKLSETTVEEAMLPIAKVHWIDSRWPFEQIAEFMKNSGRSNFPVASGDLSKLEGVVRALDAFAFGSVRSALREPVWIESSETLIAALERLRPIQTRMLLVQKDGDLRGILTLNDVLEQLVGSIRDT